MIPSSQKKLLFFLSLDLVILVLFVWLAAPSLVGKIKATSRQYLQNQEALMGLDWRESLAKELEEKYQERQTDLLTLEEAFLDTGEAVGFISTLEKIAQQTGNIFEIRAAKSFAQLTKDEEESFLIFRISLWGDFSSLLLFLANLENNPYPPYRLIEIESLTIKRLGERGLDRFSPGLKTGSLETVLGIKVYTQ